MVNLERLFKMVAEHYDMVYSNETPSAENLVIDKFGEEPTMWQNTIEDGVISEDRNGRPIVRRHIRLMFLSKNNFHSGGMEWSDIKMQTLETAVKAVESIFASASKMGEVEKYSDTSFETGFDQFDVNMAYVLCHLYIQERITECPIVIEDECREY